MHCTTQAPAADRLGGITFLCDFVLVYLQVHSLPDFAFSQMFTVYYEWLGVFAVIGMALYNGQRGSGHKQLFYWFYRHTFIFSTGHPALSTRLRGKESLWHTFWQLTMTTTSAHC